jgi:hypothetical protein
MVKQASSGHAFYRSFGRPKNEAGNKEPIYPGKEGT